MLCATKHWYFSHPFYSNMLMLSVHIYAHTVVSVHFPALGRFLSWQMNTHYFITKAHGCGCAASMWTAPWPFNFLDKGINLIYQTVVQLLSLNFNAAARSYLSHIDDTSIWNTWFLQQKHSREEGMNKRGRGVEWGKFTARESTSTGVVHGLPPPPVPPVVRPR